MKKYSFLLLLSIVLTSCGNSPKDQVATDTVIQTAEAVKDSTTVQVIDSSYSFGKIIDGEKVEYSYRFKNTGTRPLVILDASASCGCTVPQKPEQPVLPGDTGFIKIVFDSKGRVGNAYKTVRVTSNANPEFPQLVLTGDVAAKK